MHQKKSNVRGKALAFFATKMQAIILYIRRGLRSRMRPRKHIIHTKLLAIGSEVNQAYHTYEAGFDQNGSQTSILYIRSGLRSNMRSSNTKQASMDMNSSRYIIHTKQASIKHEVEQAYYTYAAAFDRTWGQASILYIRSGLRSIMRSSKHIIHT